MASLNSIEQREIARFEKNVRADLRERRWLRVHVTLIGVITFLSCWGLSSALLYAGVASLPMRHAGALLGAYIAYLLMLWGWSNHLLGRDDGLGLANGLNAIDLPWGGARTVPLPPFQSDASTPNVCPKQPA